MNRIIYRAHAYGDVCQNCHRELSEHESGYWRGEFVPHHFCPPDRVPDAGTNL